MKRKESPFIKVRRNLFNSNDMAQLMAEEGATGAGTYILIACYLSQCENAVGSMKLLNEIAAKAHKGVKYIEHIIRDYGLFNVSDVSFTCKLVTKSMHIVTEIDCGEDQKECQQKCDTDAADLQLDGNTVATDLQPSSFSPHLAYVRTRGRINRDRDRNKDRDKDKPSTPTVVEEKGGGGEAVSDFIEKVFEDDNWRNSIKVRRQIDLDDDDVMDIVKREFAECCTANNMMPHIDGFDLTQARQYCYRWLNKEHANRRQLDRQIHEMIRSRNKNDNAVSNYSEEYGFGYVIEGERYDLFGNTVPLDAPPSRTKDSRWDKKTKSWIKAVS